MILYLVSSLILTIETTMKSAAQFPSKWEKEKRTDRVPKAQTPKSSLKVFRKIYISVEG